MDFLISPAYWLPAMSTVEIDEDRRLGVHAIHSGDALEAGRCDHGEAGDEALKLLRRGAHEQLMNEEVLARELVHHTHGQVIGLVCAGKAVEHEDVAALQIGHHAVIDALVFFRADGHVHLAPVDVVMDGGGVYHKAVVRGTPGVFAGRYDERTGVRKLAFAARERVFHKLRRGQVAVNRFRRDDPEGFDVGLHLSTPLHFRFLIFLFLKGAALRQPGFVRRAQELSLRHAPSNTMWPSSARGRGAGASSGTPSGVIATTFTSRGMPRRLRTGFSGK